MEPKAEKIHSEDEDGDEDEVEADVEPMNPELGDIFGGERESEDSDY